MTETRMVRNFPTAFRRKSKLTPRKVTGNSILGIRSSSSGGNGLEMEGKGVGLRVVARSPLKGGMMAAWTRQSAEK